MPIAMNFNYHNLPCASKNDFEKNLSKYSSTLSMKAHKTSLINSKIHQIDLEELTHSSSTHRITIPNAENEKWLAIASSNEYILVGGGSSSTLRLYDFQGKEIRLIDIKTFAAFDLAWSSVLNGFLIAGYDRLQIYNIETDQLTQVENINLMNKKDNYFWSITCHNNDLFIVLSDGLESIWRLSLPSFKRIQTLSGSEIRESNDDDRISCIRTNGQYIGMTLRQNKTYQWRVDLFDYVTMTRLHRGLTIGYGIGAFNFIERCILSPINDHQWLIIGGYKVQPNALTLMDDRTGEIKQIERQNKHEFISNICMSENDHQQQIVTMIIMDNQTNQRQIQIIQQ